MSDSINKAALKKYFQDNSKISGELYESLLQDLGLQRNQTMEIVISFDVTDLDPMGDTWKDAVRIVSRRFGADLESFDDLGAKVSVTVEDKD